MPRMPAAGAFLMFIAAVLWATRLAFGNTPWTGDAAAVLAATVVLFGAIVALAGLLAPSRWVRNAASGLAVVAGALAVTLAADPWWWAATVATFAGIVLVWAPASDSWFRGMAKPEPVPLPAVLLTLGLVLMPGVTAAASDDVLGAGAWTLIVCSVVLGWAYGRALPWTVWIARLAYPVVVVVGAGSIGLPGGAVVAAGGGALVGLAWTGAARLAAEPLTPRTAETVSILPEMVPAELMESAGYDRKGQPKDGP